MTKYCRLFMLALALCPVGVAAMDERWQMPASVEEFQRQFEAEMNAAKAARAKLKAVSGKRTAQNTLSLYDEIQYRLGRADHVGSIFKSLHPEASWRDAGAKASLQVDQFAAEVSLDRGIYDALAVVTDVPEDARWSVERTLATMKRGGVLLPDQTRSKIQSLRSQIASLEQTYAANLAANRRELRIPAAQLDTLPADFLRSHPAEPDGMVTITNDPGDYEAVMAYVQNAAVRKQADLLFSNRGYPENTEVVADLVRSRHELARAAGFPNFAEFTADSRMVGTARRHADFLRSLERASEVAAKREYGALLAEKKLGDPQAQQLNAEDVNYFERLVRESRFKYDVRQTREYFPYTAVKEAVLGTAAALFQVEYRPVKGIATWHPSVEVYDVLDEGKVIGRFFLDMHPRPNKYQHFASGTLRAGVAGKQLPETVLLCNFPDPAKGPALIEPDRVRTFFHEFGHLMHAIFRGHNRWSSAARPESDFMEAPSQLLEEWLNSPDLLIRFTKHYKTGERMPLEMARTLIQAKDFGKGRRARASVAISWAFLDLHDDAEPVSDVRAVYRSHHERLGVPLAEGGHPELTITHMGNASYAAAYYTYAWSQVIAKDLFTRFDPKNLLDAKMGREYRDKVLSPGGIKPAATLVRDFLGRPFNEKAYERWLSR